MEISKSIKAIGGLVLLGLVLLVVFVGVGPIWKFVHDPFNLKANALAEAQQKAAQAKLDKNAAEGQKNLQQDATGIRENELRQTEHTRIIHDEHVKVIQAAPGASTPVGAGVISALNRGLCEYPEFSSDPGCTQVRGRNQPSVPRTSEGPRSAPE